VVPDDAQHATAERRSAVVVGVEAPTDVPEDLQHASMRGM
jgi:hypothetical protein